MKLFRVKGQQAEINPVAGTTNERLLARMQRIAAVLEKDKRHPKRKALEREFNHILNELGAREEVVNEMMKRLGTEE